MFRTILCAFSSTAVMFSLSGHALFAQSISSQAAMHAQVQSLYGFSPSKVSAEVRDRKSGEMDSFWNEVKAHPDTELPFLRKELADESDPTFFFADGSALLLSLSQSSGDRAIAASAFSRVDLADFDWRQYLLEIHSLAVQGVDVTPAALHMLDDPKFQVYLPEHGAYKLDHAACLQEALLPLPADVWMAKVLERLKSEQDETSLQSLLLLLFYAQTDQADQAIQQTASNPSRSAKTRDFAKLVLAHERELGVGKTPSQAVEKKIREERMLRMHAVSDEAMDDLEVMTKQIARARTLPH